MSYYFKHPQYLYQGKKLIPTKRLLADFKGFIEDSFDYSAKTFSKIMQKDSDNQSKIFNIFGGDDDNLEDKFDIRQIMIEQK